MTIYELDPDFRIYVNPNNQDKKIYEQIITYYMEYLEL
jgi:hypothetical protein